MGYLEKEFILHERNEKGKLIPIDYPIPELNNETVRVIPLTRGALLSFAEKRKAAINKRIQELQGMAKDKGKDKEVIAPLSVDEREVTEDLIIKHVIQPKFTKEELKSAKLVSVIDKKTGEKYYKDLLIILMDAIYAVSGLEIDIENEEEKIKKN